MITKTDSRGVQNGKELVRLAFKSTDNKPTTGIMNGSTGIEVNTGKKYVFDEESGEWTEIASSGGGGGGGGSSDFSTAEVTIIVDAAGGGGLNGGIANLSEGYGFLKNGSIVTMAGAAAGETINVTAILIEGEAIYNIVGGIVGNTTGGVSYDPENDTVKVIGDGSITITFDQ